MKEKQAFYLIKRTDITEHVICQLHSIWIDVFASSTKRLQKKFIILALPKKVNFFEKRRLADRIFNLYVSTLTNPESQKERSPFELEIYKELFN